MKKLETREDIENLVNSFYNKVIKDEKIGFFFTEVARIELERHLPKMYAFWESVLFGQMTYKGNPMGAHFPVNEIHAMEQQHFDRWLELWKAAVEESFTGYTADMAINKSENIAKLMAFKMELARRL